MDLCGSLWIPSSHIVANPFGKFFFISSYTQDSWEKLSSPVHFVPKIHLKKCRRSSTLDFFVKYKGIHARICSLFSSKHRIISDRDSCRMINELKRQFSVSFDFCVLFPLVYREDQSFCAWIIHVSNICLSNIHKRSEFFCLWQSWIRTISTQKDMPGKKRQLLMENLSLWQSYQKRVLFIFAKTFFYKRARLLQQKIYHNVESQI